MPPDYFPLGTPLELIRNAAAERAPLRGSVRVIVVLVDFSDRPMTQSKDHFSDLFFSTGKLPHGSVCEYYTEVTGGLVTVTGEVVGPFRMPQTAAWYSNGNFGIGKGPGEARAPRMAKDAAMAADPSVNFAPYDNDHNGFVDAFIVVHSGPGGEVTGNSSDIWSHKWTLPSVYAADGTKIYGYLTVPEDSKIGVCCHELGHLLFGFPDLYDTDYTSAGIGNWCLMSGGSWNGGGDVPAHPSAWCKINQGWASVTTMSTDGVLTLPDVKTSKNVARLWKDGTEQSEYFLIENRQQTGYDADLPGGGLLVWHIDDTQPDNTNEDHYKVGLLQADGHRDLELNHNRGDAGDPYPGSANNRSLTASTSPSTRAYTGQDTCVSITKISDAQPTMTATVAVRCAMSVTKDLVDARHLRPAHTVDQREGLSSHRNGSSRLAKLEARVAALEEELGTVPTEPSAGDELQHDPVGGAD
jgi:immune inhibitor A